MFGKNTRIMQQQKQQKMNTIVLKKYESLGYIACQSNRYGTDMVIFRENIEGEAAEWFESHKDGLHVDIDALILYDGPYYDANGKYAGECTSSRSQQLYYYSHCCHCHTKQYTKNFDP